MPPLVFQPVSMSVESFYDEIVAKGVVDVDSPEIQDIASALEELLRRFVNKLTDDGETKPTFKLSYLQKCGSIAEKTSLWKSVKRNGKESKFIEFDYLAVMENDESDLSIFVAHCKGCRKVCLGAENIHVHTMNKTYFLDPLYELISEMCPCVVEHFTSYSGPVDISNACLKCKAIRETGYLQIDKTSEFQHIEIKRGHIPLNPELIGVLSGFSLFLST